MKRFSDLYWKLDSTTSTNQKIEALKEYFVSAPPEDAACGLRVLCGAKQLRAVSTRSLREWAAEFAEIPLWLVEESYAHVGDLAETLALILPDQLTQEPNSKDHSTEPLPLSRCFEATIRGLKGKPDSYKRHVVEATWKRLTPRERIVWHKLVTGGCRVGVSRTLVARALAEMSGLEPAVLAERMMAATIETAEDFQSLISPHPTSADSLRPYPFFLASPISNEPQELGSVMDWQAEWKWDGMRAQVVRRSAGISIWSRGEERMNDAFPEIVEAAEHLPDGTVLDGELLAAHPNNLLPFSMLSRRASRKRAGKKIRTEIPAVFVAYDLLEARGKDIRSEPLSFRRRELLTVVPSAFQRQPALSGGPASLHHNPAASSDIRMFHSPLIDGHSWDDLALTRPHARRRGRRGRGDPRGHPQRSVKQVRSRERKEFQGLASVLRRRRFPTRLNSGEWQPDPPNGQRDPTKGGPPAPDLQDQGTGRSPSKEYSQHTHGEGPPRSGTEPVSVRIHCPD